MALAVVTGSNSGIGLATAVALARASHTVVAATRNLERGAEIRKIAEEEKLRVHLQSSTSTMTPLYARPSAK